MLMVHVEVQPWRSITVRVKSPRVFTHPVEYVIVRKLEYYRESGSDRHLRDIAGIVRVSRATINDEALRGLLEQRGLVESWERAVAS